MSEELKVNEIDFLPDRFREAKIKRSANAWRVITALMFAALLSAAAFYQQRLLWQAREHLAEAEAMFARATVESKQISAEQAAFAPVQDEAALFTYLRHPWPRTQLLNGILQPLPDSAQLKSLQFSFEAVEKPIVEAAQTVAAENPADKTPSPQRDLKRLHQELDNGRMVISISGLTRDVPAFHAYIGKLERNKLFPKVELVSIGAASSTDTANSQFSVRVTVKPGYGQPDGPTIEPQISAAPQVAIERGSR